MPLLYGGRDWPDLLASCPGYEYPSGPPIILQLGTGQASPNVIAHSFKKGTLSLEHCVFDETTYTNDSGYDQSVGRSVLGTRDAIVLIPRQPLDPGVEYSVSITVYGGAARVWSFTAAASASRTAQLGLEEMDFLVR